MKWLREFLDNPRFSETDKTDRSSLKDFRRQIDKSFGAETAHPPTDKTDKSPIPAAGGDSPPPDPGELEDSLRRLEAMRISVAVWPDGRMEIVATGDPVAPGAMVFSPRDMLVYVHLDAQSRRLMREFKQQFPHASWEWRER